MTNKYMYFIANWKMFGGLKTLNSLDKTIKFFKTFKKNKFFKIIYCPPSTLIYLMSKKLQNYKIDVGAQNCHQNENYGPFTGSINSMMLKKIGAKYVIIGHSENRQAGETDSLLNAKIKSALKITKRVLLKQIKLGLKNIKFKKNIIVAYEPVWSIGTGIIPKSKDLFETIKFIKSNLKNSKVIYGGSVNSKNISELRLINNIDGFLIGSASQDSKKFIDIIKKTYN